MKRALPTLALALTLSSCAVHLDAGARRSSGLRHHRAEGALGPYSTAVESGPFLFLAGKIGEHGACVEVTRLPGDSRIEITVIARR
ncbi:MAG: hypothetical protein VYE81_07260 [Planctomycetota bacterium]|nr:hypothetical protein [Planctomycetota bacterium]